MASVLLFKTPSLQCFYVGPFHVILALFFNLRSFGRTEEVFTFHVSLADSSFYCLSPLLSVVMYLVKCFHKPELMI